MKYLNFGSSGSKLEVGALHANLLKSHSITGIFQRISPQVQNSNTDKSTLMDAYKDNFILEIFLNGGFSKTAAKIYLF